MNVETFIGILVICATATSIGIELFKKLLEVFKIKYKPIVVAVIVSFLVGVAEVIIYAANGKMAFNWVTALLSICMGFVNMVGCTVGYDTVKAFIRALWGKAE